MRFYIASKLENAEQVKRVASVLKAAGHKHTYDWTTHGSVKECSVDRLKEVMMEEFYGVKDAEMVIVLMPGGRGTHVELGMSIAFDHVTMLCSETDDPFKCDDNTSAFYWGDNIYQCVGTMDEWLVEILSRAKKIDDDTPKAVTTMMGIGIQGEVFYT